MIRCGDPETTVQTINVISIYSASVMQSAPVSSEMRKHSAIDWLFSADDWQTVCGQRFWSAVLFKAHISAGHPVGARCTLNMLVHNVSQYVFKCVIKAC